MRFDVVDDLESPEALLRGEVVLTEALTLKRDSGSQLRDLMGETFGVLRLVSERFVSLAREASLTGWCVYPVRLLDYAGAELGGYHGLAVTGRCGPIDRSHSQLIARVSRDRTKKPLYAEIGLFFEMESWDGSDLFIPAGTSIVCLTERAANVVSEGQLTNVQLIPLAEYQLGLHADRPPKV
jgi:hypothetical protein